MKSRGLVIARHRGECLIETEDGQNLNALAGSKKTRPLTGDEICWHKEADGTPVIDEIMPRRSLLERIDNRGRAEGVAANVSLLLVVVAPEPAPDWPLVDRYFVAAASMNIGAGLIRNKLDIADAEVDERAASYRQIGYKVVACSARQGHGIAELATLLRGQRGVLVGQSGAGKSSLLNALLDSNAQTVGSLSRRRALGRHTTTAAFLHRLPDGGELIDSPGVRRYAPHVDNPADLAAGFVEFRESIGHCRFNDCLHVDEPGCAVRKAVADGRIDERRYASFRAMLATLRSLQ